MRDVFLILTLISLASVLVVLFVGLFAMAKGGTMNARHGNRLMRLRIFLQGLTVVLFAIAMLS